MYGGLMAPSLSAFDTHYLGRLWTCNALGLAGEVRYSEDGHGILVDVLEDERTVLDPATGAKRRTDCVRCRAECRRLHDAINAGGGEALARRLSAQIDGFAPYNRFALSPDGRYVARGNGSDMTLFDRNTGGRVRIIERVGLEKRAPGWLRRRAAILLPSGNGTADALAFSPDGRTLAVADDGVVQLYDLP